MNCLLNCITLQKLAVSLWATSTSQLTSLLIVRSHMCWTSWGPRIHQLHRQRHWLPCLTLLIVCPSTPWRVYSSSLLPWHPESKDRDWTEERGGHNSLNFRIRYKPVIFVYTFKLLHYDLVDIWQISVIVMTFLNTQKKGSQVLGGIENFQKMLLIPHCIWSLGLI